MSAAVRASVCMATYNAGAYLDPQVDSILAQLGPRDELIASDNGSTDGTRARLGELAAGDARVTVLDRPADRATGTENLIANFENALSRARGGLVLLSDQDDVWAPDRLARTVRLLEDYDFVAGDATVVDGAGEVLAPSYLSAEGLRRGWLRALYRNPYLGCTIGMRRGVLAKALPFPAGIPMHDIYLGMVAETFFDAHLTPAPLVLYRRHGGNASSATDASPYSLTEKLRFRWRTILALAQAARR